MDALNPTNRGISRWVRSRARRGSRGLVGSGPGPAASALFQAARCSQLRGEGRRNPGLARPRERIYGFGSRPGTAGKGRWGRQGPAASGRAEPRMFFQRGTRPPCDRRPGDPETGTDGKKIFPGGGPEASGDFLKGAGSPDIAPERMGPHLFKGPALWGGGYNVPTVFVGAQLLSVPELRRAPRTSVAVGGRCPKSVPSRVAKGH